MRISKIQLASLVDELGQAKAVSAAACEREKVLKEKLIAVGVTEADGEFFRATISTCDRETPDKVLKAKIEELIATHLTRQFVVAHTNTTEVTSVKVVARVKP